MEIKVLGPGCAKCKATYRVVEKVVSDNKIDAHLVKVEDIVDMMSYNIISTPAVVVDGVVKICALRSRSEKGSRDIGSGIWKQRKS